MNFATAPVANDGALFARMRFKGQWRDYQAHALEQMEGLLGNGRLHVVAAPGAGKTILGLEIMRRLGRRAVVFAPTVAIRDQWAQRLVPLFLDDPPGREETSYDIATPGQLTLVTYQALDGLRRSGGIDRLVGDLNAGGPLTLVLDEAHHLRREWWVSLERLAASLADVRIVALTATPPYDAGFAEWSRYQSLCGPIDLEIGIPELVRNGDLCPHQDHVILSEPTHDALDLLDRRRRAIWRLQRDLWADEDLLDSLQAHPWLRRPEDHVEAILDAPEMLSAVLVLLAGAGCKLPAPPLKLLGVPARAIPRPSFFWLETFLDGVTGRHATMFDIGAARLKALRGRLHRQGLVEGRRVRLREARSIFQLMASSIAKLDSIAAIARTEQEALGDALRMVVLSDHIHAGELPTCADAEFRPSRLGVIPIFEHLRRAGAAPDALGVLTGTLVIVPRAALPALYALAAEHPREPCPLRTLDLPSCPAHVRVEVTAGAGARLVQLVTALFGQGAVKILVERNRCWAKAGTRRR